MSLCFRLNSLSRLYMKLQFFCLNRGGVSVMVRTVGWRTADRTGERSREPRRFHTNVCTASFFFVVFFSWLRIECYNPRTTPHKKMHSLSL